MIHFNFAPHADCIFVVVFVTAPFCPIMWIPFTSCPIAVFSQELVEPSLPTPSNRRRKCISRGNSGHQAMVGLWCKVPLENYGNMYPPKSLPGNGFLRGFVGTWVEQIAFFKRFCFCSWCLLGRGCAYSGALLNVEHLSPDGIEDFHAGTVRKLDVETMGNEYQSLLNRVHVLFLNLKYGFGMCLVSL